MHQHKILVVDDKINMLKLLRRILEKDYEVITSEGGREGLKIFKEDQFDLVISDIKMPDVDGITLLREIKEINHDIDVILITAYASIPSAVEAMKAGAYDYIKKPFEPDELTIVVRRALERKKLLDRTRYLEREVEGVFHPRNVVGKSSSMEGVYKLVRRVVNSDTTVLISGESGTGKELIARAIHYESKRNKSRFVAVNCGAIPKDLLESELFGHVKGAFSGAHSSKKGLIEDAEGGTLFLDEISELEQDLQVKMNRFLQEKEIRPVGANQDKAVDVRVIAATNVDLEGAVANNRFREDLFYRLNVYPIQVPPLRARKDDIPLLVSHL
jgi:DNA-binding NtrC family response regulator